MRQRSANGTMAIHHQTCRKLSTGYAIVELSDLHVEMSGPAIERIGRAARRGALRRLRLTGDYRGGTCGPYDTTLAGMARVRAGLKDPICGVLGNHDTICMVPGFEAMGVGCCLTRTHYWRGVQPFHVGGMDDADFYGMDRTTKAAAADARR